MRKNERFNNALAAAALVATLVCGCNKSDIITDADREPETANRSAFADKVYEWTPAPGQFINDTSAGDSWPDGMSAAEAAAWAQSRLERNYAVSLGAFGGYIVAGFDHEVMNSYNDYEIGIGGNAFNNASGCSNEPGIVYVMQDTNGNGLPDDTWYELRGSDTFAPTTDRAYSVTYYRPASPRTAVKWTDNRGGSGEVPYQEIFHNQPTYYPVWVKADTYTLSGTCLEARTAYDQATGNWTNPAFEWGYADNMGSDSRSFDFAMNCNRFCIRDAVDADGKPVNLTHINFVKVQTGVNFSAGWLGELSTEVTAIVHLNFGSIMN